MANNFENRHCKPCEGIGRSFTDQETSDALRLVPQWTIGNEGKSIIRQIVMKDFQAAVNLINKIADIANKENHHPDIFLTNYRNLEIALSTHKLGGLTENDFIMASKIDGLPMEVKG